VTDPVVLCAALLHDTIEDTTTTAEELTAAFGQSITDVVLEVTDDKKLDKAKFANSFKSNMRAMRRNKPNWSSLPTKSAICATSLPHRQQTGAPSGKRNISTGPNP
jgi:hypothetical protein